MSSCRRRKASKSNHQTVGFSNVSCSAFIFDALPCHARPFVAVWVHTLHYAAECLQYSSRRSKPHRSYCCKKELHGGWLPPADLRPPSSSSSSPPRPMRPSWTMPRQLEEASWWWWAAAAASIYLFIVQSKSVRSFVRVSE